MNVILVSDKSRQINNSIVYVSFQSYVSCSLGIWMVGALQIPYSVTNALTSILLGQIGKYVGRMLILTFGKYTGKMSKLTFG